MKRPRRRNWGTHIMVAAVVVVMGTASPWPAGLRAQNADAQRTDGSTETATPMRDQRLLEGLERLDPPGEGGSRSAGRRPMQRTEIVGPSGEGSDIGERNPLARIGRHMRRVEDLLNQRNVSGETQQSQRQIVTQLDELIETLSKSTLAREQRNSSRSPKGDQQGQQTGRQAARTSGGPGDQEAGVQVPTAVQGGAEEIWGHLPERFRRQLRNAEAIEFLPKYRKLIEDYYRRLAEDRGIQQ